MKQIIYMSFLLFYVLSSCSSRKTSVVTKTKIITGFVFDESDKQPLPGTNIKVKASKTKKATTDFDGKFEIELNEGDILIIEFIGFQNKEVSITTQNNYEIFLDVYKKVCKKCDRKKNREIKRYVRNGGRFIPSEPD
jgi:hypothetical protein